MTNLKTLMVDMSSIPNQPVLTEEEELDQAFADPRLRKVLILAFMKLQNQIIDLRNEVRESQPGFVPEPKRTSKQTRVWLRKQLRI